MGGIRATVEPPGDTVVDRLPVEPLRDTVVTLGYGGATRRCFSDTRVLLEKCGAIMRDFSDTREPTGDKVR